MHFKNLQFKIFSLILFLLVAGSSGRNARHKLIRARKDIGVPDVYFVRMKESVTVEELHSYIDELEVMHKAGDNGFIAEVHGRAVEAAHGFSVKLSRYALDLVSLYLLC